MVILAGFCNHGVAAKTRLKKRGRKPRELKKRSRRWKKTKMEMLVDAARWVYAWQSQSGLTDAQMLRKYPGLGSAKTYRDIRDGKADTTAALARMGLCAIEMRDNDPAGGAGDDRPLNRGAGASRGAGRWPLTAAIGLVIATGGSGSGKSFALRGLRGFYGSRIQAIEALDGACRATCWARSLEALGKAVPVGECADA